MKLCCFPVLALGADLLLAVPGCASHPNALLIRCCALTLDSTTDSSAMVMALQLLVLALKKSVSVGLELLTSFQFRS